LPLLKCDITAGWLGDDESQHIAVSRRVLGFICEIMNLWKGKSYCTIYQYRFPVETSLRITLLSFIF